MILPELKKSFFLHLKKTLPVKKQRPSKIPIHYRDKIEKLMDELIEAGICKKRNENDNLKSWFVNLVIVLPK